MLKNQNDSMTFQKNIKYILPGAYLLGLGLTFIGGPDLGLGLYLIPSIYFLNQVDPLLKNAVMYFVLNILILYLIGFGLEKLSVKYSKTAMAIFLAILLVLGIWLLNAALIAIMELIY